MTISITVIIMQSRHYTRPHSANTCLHVANISDLTYIRRISGRINVQFTSPTTSFKVVRWPGEGDRRHSPLFAYVYTLSVCETHSHSSHVDIRDVHDAHVVLEAVRLNILPLLKRRLLASERDELRSGHVYVWEEAQDDGGLLRWTDGRRW